MVIDGQRVPALRFDHPHTQALLVALVVFRAHPDRVTNFGLRSALVLRRAHNGFLTTIMAAAGAGPPRASPLGRALDDVSIEIDRVARGARLTACA